MSMMELILGLAVAAVILISPKPIERLWARLVCSLVRLFNP